jgi:4-diphosphocytidyl-2-C-methyl-D-erythritol kinase
LEKKAFLGNDFEPLVFAKYDKIRVLREALEKENAVFSRMSGSGSTVFGLFERTKNLENIKSGFSDCFVAVCNFV